MSKLCCTILLVGCGFIGVLLIHPEDNRAWGNGFAYHGIPTEIMLVELLHSHPHNRAEAARALGIKREEAAVQPLIARVQDEQERDVVKLAGLDALGHIGDPRALSPLIHVLYHEESADVRAGAAQALAHFSDEQAMTSLLRALHTDRKILVQVSAIRALGHIRHERVVTALLDVLRSPPHSTRQTAAVQALGQLGSPRATTPLLALLRQTRSRTMRHETTKALGLIGDPQAAQPLIAVMQEADNDLLLKGIAITALGQIHDQRAVPPLIKELDAQDLGIRLHVIRALGRLGERDATTSLVGLLQTLLTAAASLPLEPVEATFANHLRLLHEQIAVVQALRNIADPRSVDVLLSALEAHVFPQSSAEGLRLRAAAYQRRRAAMVALSTFKDHRVIETFIALLGDTDVQIRADSARLLGELGDRRGGLPLIATLHDADADVRFEAIRALGKLRESRAVTPLIARLNDPHTLVREQAILALAELHDKRAIAALKAWRHSTTDARVKRALAHAFEHMGLRE
jgi:HEAT repeat protein